jgi:hypothetical protein
MANRLVTLKPGQRADYKTLAHLEAMAFSDEFTEVAFGPHRADDEVLEVRAKEIGKGHEKPGENVKIVKAIRSEEGREEIMGFASWATVRVAEGGLGIYGAVKGDRKEEGRDEITAEGEIKTVANEKLCDDLFIPGDQFMAKACGGGDYHSKSECPRSYFQ